MNGTTALSVIANHAAARRFDDLSDLTIVRARQVALDFIGTMLGGYQTRLGRLAADYAARVMGGDEASIVGDGRRSSLEGAAWANAVMGKYLGMDDSHRTAGHVASELVPVVLALGEQLHLSGRQVIKAMAVGYDVMDVIQTAVKGWQRERGLDHKGQAGTLASAAAAAVAMRLPAEKIGHALALSMDMACGTEQYVYDAGACDTKDLLAGYGARNGIYAAKLADFGFEGPPGALDGPYGYFHAFGPGYDPAYLDNLDGQALARTGFKPHAGCRHVHACVDATHELLKRGQPDLSQIAAIEVDSYQGCEVRIVTRSGEQYRGRVEYAKGEPENMLTDEEFEEKFRYLAGDLLPEERIARLIACAGRLEQLEDVNELVSLTVPSRRETGEVTFIENDV